MMDKQVGFLWRKRARNWPVCTDLELMEGLKAGQPAALAALYDRYASLVYGLALQILGCMTEAEDLTQEVFALLWRKPSYDPRQGSINSLLCRLTRAQALERLRSRGSQRRLGKPWQPLLIASHRSPAPFEQLSVEERRQPVQEALSQLSESQRQLLELLYYRGLSAADIAQELGMPLATVQARSRQALCKLRRSLRPLLDQ
jgi:RNA polymerase sigma-70 factor (ECF subfamily)